MINFKLQKFKQELIKEIRKEDNKWYCKLCKKDLPPSDYCVEHHFKDIHNLDLWGTQGHEHNNKWYNVDVNDVRAIKCINRVYRRFKK